ncbi:hypothetical protein QTP88_000294 [Uroleucon formosanum]
MVSVVVRETPETVQPAPIVFVPCWVCFAKPELTHKDGHGRYPSWEIQLREPGLRWEDVIRKYCEARVTDRERWRIRCVAGWF